MTSKIHLEIIKSEDCFACRQCCHFGPEDAAFAPLFTGEQRLRIADELPTEGVQFEEHGQMWRVVLRGGASGDELLCPLLDVETGGCRVYNYGVFDCDTWPYQIMARDGRLLFTLSRSCPVVGERTAAMRADGERLLPRMLAQIRQHPERVIPFYDGVEILADLGPAPMPPQRD